MVDFRPAGCNVVVGRVTYIRPPRALEEPNLGVLCRPNTDNRICRAGIVSSSGRLHIITTRFLSRLLMVDYLFGRLYLTPLPKNVTWATVCKSGTL